MPGGYALQAGAMGQQWHCGAEARPPLSLGTRQLHTAPLLAQEHWQPVQQFHVTFWSCYARSGVRCGAAHQRGEGGDPGSRESQAFSFLWAMAEWLSQGAAGVMTIVASQCSTNLGYSSRVVWSQSTCHRIRMLFWPGSNLAWAASTLFTEARDQKSSWDGQCSPSAWSVEIGHLGPQHAMFYLSVSLRKF